jgi:outer membrane protein TolC
VTATQLNAVNKEAQETEQHRAEACAEIESLREQLGIQTKELAELLGKYIAVTAERDRLWSLVPPTPIQIPRFEVQRLVDIDQAGAKIDDINI